MAKSKKSDKGTTVLQTAGNVVDMPANLIDADYEWNARTLLDYEELAGAIKREGQQSPVIVRLQKNGRYRLLAGFRRFAAITSSVEKGGLGRDSIRATIWDGKGDNEDTIELNDTYTNLIENVARKDLTPFDLAVRCHMIHDEHEESPGKIAGRLGKSESYVDNLIRAVKNLEPSILRRWKDENGPKEKRPAMLVLSTDEINRLAKKGRTHEEQLVMFAELLGTTPADKDKTKSGNGAVTTPTQARASQSEIGKAIIMVDMVEEKDDVDESYLKGVRAALEWAAGKKRTIPHVYTPGPTKTKTTAK